MPVLLITSDRPGVGKTAMAAALVTEVQTAGKTAMYIKPLSADPDSDLDVAYFREHLIPEGTTLGQPQLLGEDRDLSESQSRSIAEIVERASSEAQAVLIEAPSLSGPGGDRSSLIVSLAQTLDAKVLVLQGFHTNLSAATIQQVCSLLIEHLAGVVINLVPKYRQRQLLEDMTPGLDSQRIRMLGSIPTDRTMAAVTVRQIAQHLEGQWVAGENGAGTLADHVLIGGNIMDSGETYFGRHDNKAVLVRGDRPDIQLACLNTSTACLVLTGGFTPTQYVFHEAERRDVPLLVVNGSTAATAEALEEVLTMPSVHHPAKIRRFWELMRDNVDIGVLPGMLQGIAKNDQQV